MTPGGLDAEEQIHLQDLQIYWLRDLSNYAGSTISFVVFSNTDWRGYHLRDANNQIFQGGLIVFKRKLATTFHVDYEHKRLI